MAYCDVTLLCMHGHRHDNVLRPFDVSNLGQNTPVVLQGCKPALSGVQTVKVGSSIRKCVVALGQKLRVAIQSRNVAYCRETV